MPPQQELPKGWSTLPPGWSSTPPSGTQNMPPRASNAFIDTLSGTAPWQQTLDKWAQPEPYATSKGIGGNVRTGVKDLGAGLAGLGAMAAHPWRTLGGMVEPENLLPLGTIPGYGQPKPPIPWSQTGGEATAAIPQVAASLLLGPKAVESVGSKVNAVGDWIRPTSSPNIVPPLETSSESLAQAIRPVGGINPKTIEAIQYEAPAVREFGQRTGNPLNTRAEGFKAAQGVGQEGVAHYNQHILGPNEDVQVQLPGNVSPKLGHVATLKEINGRIGEINDIFRAATGGKSEGATMTAMERTGLEAEAKALRSKLYDTLSEKTGIPGDQIRDLREGYGGQFTIADALQSGRMGTLNRTGALSQGGGGVPMGVGDLAQRAVNWLRGGEEAIGNRQFRSRIRAFEPQAPTRPMPNIPPPRPYESGPTSPEIQARIGATGAGTEPLPPRVQEFLKPVPMQGPGGRLPSVNEVPALREDAEAAERLRQEQNAKYRQKKIGL